ncbi:gamma-glutamylcyclotransferase 2-3 [Iris pallida]|uniref:glutathione-specific gamma-glutamylcyclotransferase n=1 Tax=Iris pallida TaxID=29817 RepID=A0AAX6I5L9_IRIPA|nr:gamma-glutamylcyclotransferase 2-3 [Iris pallida]
MVMWVFGYGSLIWKAGFNYDGKLFGCIKGYRRVFYQGSTDHRGTPEFPGRTVTLEPLDGQVCWGVAYKVSGEENEKIALSYLEVREKQYDTKVYLDFYTDPNSIIPEVTGVLVYVASPDKRINENYLGPAPLEEMAKQIVQAEGPSGPNRDYLFQLEEALNQLGCEDTHVRDLANEVRNILSEKRLQSDVETILVDKIKETAEL